LNVGLDKMAFIILSAASRYGFPFLVVGLLVSLLFPNVDGISQMKFKYGSQIISVHL